jgi:membrane-bound lytic murein transglycosylase
MKKPIEKLIIAALSLSITTSTFASCIEAYEVAAEKRDTSNGIMLTVGAIATVVTAAIIADNNSNNNSSTSSARNNQPNRTNRTRRHRSSTRHRRHTYGVYYFHTYENDGRWLGTNSFDKVLMGYNDAVVASFNENPYGYSSELYEFEKKVAKKIIRLAKRARVSNRVRDIKNTKILTAEDKVVLRNALMDGIENTGSTSFCPDGKALKRTKVIKELASAVLDSRS